jgi:AcrR family transcriptional regulator
MASAQRLRARIREEVKQEIIDRARDQLRESGPGGLSLRRIMRDLEWAPSAIHRYFPTRDDLMTQLIIDGFNAIGDVAEHADAQVARDDYLGRWMAASRAVREWAVNHPHEYALVYGSPVPQYSAPEETVQPATRDKAVFGAILSQANAAGRVHLAPESGATTKAADEDLNRVREAVLPDVPDHIVRAAIVAWAGLYGIVSLEVFGHFNHMIEDRATLFDHAMAMLARGMGLGV